MSISVVTAIEFAEGFVTDKRSYWEITLRSFQILSISKAMAWQAGQMRRRLREEGVSIGDNDLLIATTAIHHSLRLVTRNERHFGNIDGLNILTY